MSKVWSDLGPNCLLKVSADDTSRKRVNLKAEKMHQKPSVDDVLAACSTWVNVIIDIII